MTHPDLYSADGRFYGNMWPRRDVDVERAERYVTTSDSDDADHDDADHDDADHDDADHDDADHDDADHDDADMGLLETFAPPTKREGAAIARAASVQERTAANERSAAASTQAVSASTASAQSSAMARGGASRKVTAAPRGKPQQLGERPAADPLVNAMQRR
jgi:hypothetical protein